MIVALPYLVPYVELPTDEAMLLRAIILGGAIGITTLELRACFIMYVNRKIKGLRSKGAIIEIRRTDVRHLKGMPYRTMTHYIYRGWEQL